MRAREAPENVEKRNEQPRTERKEHVGATWMVCHVAGWRNGAFVLGFGLSLSLSLGLRKSFLPCVVHDRVEKLKG